MKGWRGDHLLALGCYHGSVGSGWDVVVEKYISVHNTYEYDRK